MRAVVLAAVLVSTSMLTAPPTVAGASDGKAQTTEADDRVRALILDAARDNPLDLWMAADFPWARLPYAKAARAALAALEPMAPYAKFHRGRMIQIGAESGSGAEAAQLIREAAEAGEGDAMAWYGTMLLHDPDSETTRDAARRWLVRAVDQGSWFAGLQLTMAYRDGILPGRGFETTYWHRITEDLRAKSGRDPIHLTAPGTAAPALPATASKEVRHLWGAARQGNSEAQYKLAMAYERGEGIAADPDLAADWYRRAALNGIARGAYEIARLMRDKRVAGTAEDMRSLIQEAARFRVADAEAWLGFLTMTGGLKISQDSAEAAYWMRRAALRGSAWGKFLFSRALANGDGVKADLQASERWMQEAAEEGWIPAMRDMAARSVGSDGGILDLSQFEHWMTRAMRAGDSQAERDLGVALLGGAPNETAKRRGLGLLESAARSGDRPAHAFLASHQWDAGERGQAWAHAVMAEDAFPDELRPSRAEMKGLLTDSERKAADRLLVEWGHR